MLDQPGRGDFMVGPVYVTGMAWATALGCGLSEVWNHLLNGGSGIENIPCQYPLRNYKAAMVSTIRSDMGVSRRLRQMAGETLSNAVHDAGLEVKNDSITLCPWHKFRIIAGRL